MSDQPSFLNRAKAILVHGRCARDECTYRWTFEEGMVELIYPEEEQPYQRGSKLRVTIGEHNRLIWEDTLRAIWMRSRLKDCKQRNQLWFAAARLARQHREKEKLSG